MAESADKEAEAQEHHATAAEPPGANPTIEDIDSQDVEKEEIKASSGGIREQSKSDLKPTQSYATDASATTDAPAASQKPKSWYNKINPLQWGPVPPVPKERTPSREYKAGILSLITFQWMAPLMKVCPPSRGYGWFF